MEENKNIAPEEKKARPRIHPEKMTADALEGVAELEKLCFSQPWSRKSLELLTNEGIGVGMVCRKDGIVCAYGGMLVAVDEGQITNIATHPDFRRMGYGRAVVEALIRYAKNNRLDSISLEVRESNRAAIALYSALGFKVEGKRKDFYTKPTEAALVMILHIK
ncbi:MAG: ribosomal protein S18-alanine N-acetyltransferase [Clostridia bacterium]|nr:ribosomal protein S18-alanine N-acetyltransferase [Clostridia bacterium]